MGAQLASWRGAAIICLMVGGQAQSVELHSPIEPLKSKRAQFLGEGGGRARGRRRPFMAEIPPLFADFQKLLSPAGPESDK